MRYRLIVFIGCVACSVITRAQTVENNPADSLGQKNAAVSRLSVHSGKRMQKDIGIDTAGIAPARHVAVPPREVNFTLNNTGYWLLPWGNRRFGVPTSLFSMDYSARSMWYGFHTLSTHTTYPLWGSVTYIRFLRNIPLTTRFSLDLGWYFSGYTLPVTGPCWDFGGAGAINYDLSDRWRLQMLFDYSALEHSNMLNPLLTPMYPHSKMEMNIQFMPVQNVKLKVGYDVNGR